MTNDDIPVNTVIVCPECGASNSREDSFCGECGGSLVETKRVILRRLSGHPEHQTTGVNGVTAARNGKKCHECGKFNPERNRFCNECGNKLRGGGGRRSHYQEQSAPTIFHLEQVSAMGGVILIFAVLILVAAWVWQESAQSQLEHLEYPYDVSHAENLADSARNAGRLWNLGVILVPIGAILTAFAEVRK